MLSLEIQLLWPGVFYKAVVIRKVKVQALNDKSTDLKHCLSQQTNDFGFFTYH